MSRIAFIQKNKDGFPATANCYSAFEGFRERGFDVRLFTPSEIPDLPLTRETIVNGGINTVLNALDKIGVPRPPYINYPAELMPFFGRMVRETTLGEIRNDDTLWPIFIKPSENAKTFTGHVVADIQWLRLTSNLPNEIRVFAQTPITFLSEWRVYVCRNAVLGIGNYKGDTLLFPERERIEAMIDTFTSSPSAYSLDVGVLDSGETVLVEVNDSFALGNYGLPPLHYSKLVETRWDEMCGNA